MNRPIIIFAVVLALLLSTQSTCAQRLQIERSTLTTGDPDWDMTQARTAYAPGPKPTAITTMSKTARKGAHGYHDVFFSLSRDQGKTWTPPKTIPSLKRARQADGYEVVAGDLWPRWHQGSGQILLTGKTFNFAGGTKENFLREKISYAVMNPSTLQCGPMRIVKLPDTNRDGKPFIAPNAGCHQWVELPNGDVILPMRYQKSAKRRNYTSTVLRCRFDGNELVFAEQGTEHNIPTRRGLYEPSVTRFKNEFFLTMRADDGAWISKSEDGLNYSPHKPWTFDDGKPL